MPDPLRSGPLAINTNLGEIPLTRGEATYSAASSFTLITPSLAVGGPGHLLDGFGCSRGGAAYSCFSSSLAVFIGMRPRIVALPFAPDRDLPAGTFLLGF